MSRYCECGHLIKVPPSGWGKRHRKWKTPHRDHGLCWHCFRALRDAFRR